MRADAAAVVLTSIALLAPSPSGFPRAADKVDIESIALEDLLDLEVEAVTRRGEPGSEAPAWVFVLTADDLRRLGARTLHDALRTIPGMFGYADGLYPMIGVRGVGMLADYTTRLLVLVDGHRLNNSVGIGESYLGADFPVPLAAIERIEVIEGPVGSVYGPTAFLGVVNVVTHAAGTTPATAAAALEATQGSAGGVRAGLAGGAARSGLAFSGAASAWVSEGFTWTFPELALERRRAVPPDFRVKDADAAHALSAHARVGWRGFELSTACGEARRGIPSSPYSALVGDERTWLQNRTCYAQLGWAGTASPDLDLEARVSYDAFRYDDAFAYAPPPRDVGMFLDRASDDWLSAEVRGDWRPTRWGRVSLGVEGEAHRTTQQNWSEDPAYGVGPIDKDYLTLNAYALAEAKVRGDLRLHGGLTFYAHELYGSRFTPKLAAVWRPSARDVVKAMYAQGFRPPTAAEAFYEDGTDFLANPGLRPETTTSLELVYERQVRDAAAITLSAFRNAYSDLIRFETVPAPGVRNPRPNAPADWRQQGRNVDSLRTYGGQLGLTVRLASGVVAWGGVSAQGADGGRPANFPALSASAVLSSRWPWRPLTLSVSAAAISSRPKDETALLPDTPRAAVPAAVVASAAAALEVPGVRGLSLEVGVYGLGGCAMVHPVPGDFTPLTELADQPAPLLRAGVRWTP